MSKRGPQMQVERIEKRFKNDESPKNESPKNVSPANVNESKEDVEKLADEAVEKLGEVVKEAVKNVVEEAVAVAVQEVVENVVEEEVETQKQNSPNETQLSPEAVATINLIDEKLDKLLAEIVQRITDQANEEDVTTNSDTDSDMPPLVKESEDSESESEEEEEEEVESECESEGCGCHDKEVVQVSCTFSEVPSFVKVFAFAYLVIHGLNLYFSATSCN